MASAGSQTRDASTPRASRTPPVSRAAAAQGDRDDIDVQFVSVGWLRVSWAIGPQTLARALSSMGREGHRKRSVLRLQRVDLDDSGPRARQLYSEIELPGDASEWYLNVPPEEAAWQVELGYAYGRGKFFSLLHSPAIAATFSGERPAHGLPLATATGAEDWELSRPPSFTMHGRFVLHGETQPPAPVQINDEFLKVDPDSGRFVWEVGLSNGRAVYPVMIGSPGRCRKALLALEVNLHLLEPEPDEDD